MPYLEIHGTHVFYQYSEGEGIPLVFIHGWAGDHTRWKNQIEFFSNHFPVLIYDLEGHGKSDPAENYSMTHHAMTLSHLLERLGLSQIYLVGHSMGGMVAQQFAIDFPDRIQKLVLISTTSKIITSFRKRLAVLFMRFLLRISFDKFFKVLLSYTQRPETSEEELNALVDYASKVPHKIIRRSFAQMTAFKASKNISTFEKPVLMLVGEKDPIISGLMARDLQENMPKSSLKIIESGYHELMVDNPDIINSCILDFIKSG